MVYSVEENVLEVLKKSKIHPEIGDVFVLKVKNRGYFWGLVVKEKVRSGFGDADAVLIYIYGTETEITENIPDLKKENLIIPPLMINMKPWTMGFFKKIKKIPESEMDTFSVHCFRDTLSEKLYNENGDIIKNCGGAPLGEYGLASYGAVSRRLSAKLGLKPAIIQLDDNVL